MTEILVIIVVFVLAILVAKAMFKDDSDRNQLNGGKMKNKKRGEQPINAYSPRQATLTAAQHFDFKGKEKLIQAGRKIDYMNLTMGFIVSSEIDHGILKEEIDILSIKGNLSILMSKKELELLSRTIALHLKSGQPALCRDGKTYVPEMP